MPDPGEHTSMLTRRRLVAGAAAAASGLAGCVGDVLPGDGTSSTGSPPGELTPTAGEPTPPPCPERPDPATTENAGEFVQSFERAYAWRAALDRFEDLDDLTVHVDDPTVVAENDGVLAYVDVFLSVTTDGTIADEEYVASYRLADGRTLRAEARERVDPAAEGEAVHCPPG